MEKAFQITFEDGSNPYFHFECDEDTHKKALDKWRKHYELKPNGAYYNIEFYIAKEKEQ